MGLLDRAKKEHAEANAPQFSMEAFRARYGAYVSLYDPPASHSAAVTEFIRDAPPGVWTGTWYLLAANGHQVACDPTLPPVQLAAKHTMRQPKEIKAENRARKKLFEPQLAACRADGTPLRGCQLIKRWHEHDEVERILFANGKAASLPGRTNPQWGTVAQFEDALVAALKRSL